MQNTASYTTIFSGISWTWAKVIATYISGNYFYTTLPGAPAIIMSSNTSFTVQTLDKPYSSSQSAYNFTFTVSATSTSLALKSPNASNIKVNLYVMVPES